MFWCLIEESVISWRERYLRFMELLISLFVSWTALGYLLLKLIDGRCVWGASLNQNICDCNSSI